MTSLTYSLLLEVDLSGIYEKYYAKTITPGQFLNILQMDPTTVFVENWGDILRRKNWEGVFLSDKVSDITELREYLEPLVLKIGDYVKWIARLYQRSDKNARKRMLGEDIHRNWRLLKEYDTLKRKGKLPLDQRDINRIQDLGHLWSILEGAHEAERLEKLEKDREIAEKSTKVVLDNASWTVVIPLSLEASCYWGSGTHWCTAINGYGNAYRSYTAEGPLYILMSKADKQEKFQFHFPSSQFMNRLDRPIGLGSFLKENPDIRQLFISLGEIVMVNKPIRAKYLRDSGASLVIVPASVVPGPMARNKNVDPSWNTTMVNLNIDGVLHPVLVPSGLNEEYTLRFKYHGHEYAVFSLDGDETDTLATVGYDADIAPFDYFNLSDEALAFFRPMFRRLKDVNYGKDGKLRVTADIPKFYDALQWLVDSDTGERLKQSYYYDSEKYYYGNDWYYTSDGLEALCKYNIDEANEKRILKFAKTIPALAAELENGADLSDIIEEDGLEEIQQAISTAATDAEGWSLEVYYYNWAVKTILDSFGVVDKEDKKSGLYTIILDPSFANAVQMTTIDERTDSFFDGAIRLLGGEDSYVERFSEEVEEPNRNYDPFDDSYFNERLRDSLDEILPKTKK